MLKCSYYYSHYIEKNEGEQKLFSILKYAEEAEKNHKHDLNKNRPCLIWFHWDYWQLLLQPVFSCAYISVILRIMWSLKKRRRASADHLFHGFRGGDYTTNVMVHQATKDKGNKFLKVTVDLLGNFKLEGTWTGDKHPIVQIAFRQRIVGIYGIDYYLSLSCHFYLKIPLQKLHRSSLTCLSLHH